MFAYDVWVNWFEGEENAYNVFSFEEWRKTDPFDLLDQVPIIKVTPELFTHLEHSLEIIPASLLAKIKDKTTEKSTTNILPIEYAFLATDGIRTIVIDTLGYEIPMRKSRIHPEKEALVLEMVKHIAPTLYEFQKAEREYHILSLDPTYMIGLTRKEKNLKQLTFMALDQLKEENNLQKLKYYYTEWNPKGHESIQFSTKDDILVRLENELRCGWTTQHYDFCRFAIQGHPYFEALFAQEVEEISY